MNKDKVINIAYVVFFAAAIGGGFYWQSSRNRPPAKTADEIAESKMIEDRARKLLKRDKHLSLEEARRLAKREARRAMRERKRREATKVKQMSIAEAARIFDREEGKHLNEKEKRFLDELNEAMLDGDVEIVGEVADEMAHNPNPVMRRNAVEAISWFGEDGLPELAQYLLDPDPEIAELARERWSLGISEIDSDKEKVSLSKLAILSVNDADAISDYMTDLTMANDNLEIMQALVDIIYDGGQVAVNAALEQYEQMTGDPWRGLDAAEAWLRENYDPEDLEDE